MSHIKITVQFGKFDKEGIENQPGYYTVYADALLASVATEKGEVAHFTMDQNGTELGILTRLHLITHIFGVILQEMQKFQGNPLVRDLMGVLSNIALRLIGALETYETIMEKIFQERKVFGGKRAENIELWKWLPK